MSSLQHRGRSVRSHSIHIAVARDYHRIKVSQKLDIKLQKDFLDLERKFRSHSKWNQRADHRNVGQLARAADGIPDKPPIKLEEFLERQKFKFDNINKSKEIANKNIRRH